MAVHEQVVFVKCRLSRGSVPTQCLFRVTTIAGDFHGVAPLHYCYSPDRKQLDKELPRGKEVEGLAAGIAWDRPYGGIVRVELPDGELYDVSDELVSPVETPRRVSLKP